MIEVGPADPVLHGPADRRAKLERRDARDDAGQLLRQRLFELRMQAFARRDVLGDDDGLGKEVIGQLDVERQVEADRALKNPLILRDSKTPEFESLRLAGWRIIWRAERCGRRRSDLISFMNS